MKRLATGRARRILSILAVVVLIVALLAPAVALARAGGGQVGGGGSRSSGGFSSGSSGGGFSSSGGGFTSSGGGGSGGIPWVFCCVVFPVILIVVLIIMFITKRAGGGGGGGSSSYAAMPDQQMVMAPDLGADPFAEIKAADPAFNEQLFYGRVNEMFIAIQYAWMARNLEPVRRFLSDQQFSVLDNSVKTDYVAKGQVNKLDNIHIDNLQPVEVTRVGDYDSVKMLVTATCIDYTVDERTGQLVNPAELGDGKTPRTFQEYWTFMRKAGAQSKVDSSIQKCPNCGAPVTDGNYVKCAYCGVQMNDPTLDWVLMRIEQVD